MGPKSAAAAAASTPAKSEAPTEPTVADLGNIIGKNRSAAPAAKPKAKAAPTVAKDHDPDFDDAEETPAGDPTAGDDEQIPAAEDPAALDPAAPAEVDPATEANPAAPAAAGDEIPEATVAPEGLDDEDKATRKSFSPDQQKSFDKAVQKRARTIKDLKSQITERDEALAHLAAAPAVAATPTAENPLADVEDETTLATRVANSRALWKWARLHPNGGTLKDAAGHDIEIPPERVLEIQVQEEELQNFHAPARTKFLTDRGAQEAAAVQAHPWLKNKSSQGAVEIEAQLRRNPGLRSVPGIKLILADSLAGRNARLTKAKTGTAAAVAVPVAPATPAGRNPPPRVAGAVKTATTALKTVSETGRDPGNAALGALIRKR